MAFPFGAISSIASIISSIMRDPGPDPLAGYDLKKGGKDGMLGVGVATGLGQLLNAGLGIYGQYKNNQLLIDEAQKNRDFQERMSNTAYQRAVLDMKSAGLNPGMMYAGASVASTPSGGMASGMQPNVKGMEVSNILNGMLLAKQLKLMDSQIGKTNAETSNIKANTENMNLINKFYPSLTQSTIDSIVQNTATSLSVEELNKAHKVTAQLENEWIPRLRAASELQITSQAALNQVQKFLLDWEKAYRNTYGVRPGDSAIVDTCAFLCKQLGITASDAIERVKQFVSDFFSGANGKYPSVDGLPSLGLSDDDRQKYSWLKDIPYNKLTPEQRELRHRLFKD